MIKAKHTRFDVTPNNVIIIIFLNFSKDENQAQTLII